MRQGRLSCEGTAPSTGFLGYVTPQQTNNSLPVLQMEPSMPLGVLLSFPRLSLNGRHLPFHLRFAHQAYRPWISVPTSATKEVCHHHLHFAFSRQFNARFAEYSKQSLDVHPECRRFHQERYPGCC